MNNFRQYAKPALIIFVLSCAIVSFMYLWNTDVIADFSNNNNRSTSVTQTTSGMEMSCRGKVVNGHCGPNLSNVTMIKRFLKYTQYLKGREVPAIPCDIYLDKKDSRNGIYTKSSDSDWNAYNGSYVDTIYNLLNTSHTEIYEVPHYMFLSSTVGRMGNQMFQVAAVIGISCYHGYEPIITPKCELTELFDLPYVHNKEVINTKEFVQHDSWGESLNDSLGIDHKTNWTFRGHFQSFKYFARSLEVIQKSFVVRQKYLDRAQNFLNMVSKDGYENVCIHMRRGDFLLDIHVNHGYGVADVNFIKKVMSFYQNKYNFVNFIVISDEMAWCKSNLKHVVYSPFQDAPSDMALMILCDHVVVTSGTFGWWGALLSGGTTVYFSGYVRNGSTLSKGYRPQDFYPPNWIAIF